MKKIKVFNKNHELSSIYATERRRLAFGKPIDYEKLPKKNKKFSLIVLF